MQKVKRTMSRTQFNEYKQLMPPCIRATGRYGPSKPKRIFCREATIPWKGKYETSEVPRQGGTVVCRYFKTTDLLPVISCLKVV